MTVNSTDSNMKGGQMMSTGINVRVMHRQFGGVYSPIFDWNTKKSGASMNVAQYVFTKFKSDFPKGYSERPLRDGDRFELHDLSTNEVRLYEVVDYCSIQEV